jgi:hypothetical protein
LALLNPGETASGTFTDAKQLGNELVDRGRAVSLPFRDFIPWCDVARFWLARVMLVDPDDPSLAEDLAGFYGH